MKLLLATTSIFGLTAVMVNPYPVVRWGKTRIPRVDRARAQA